MFQEKTDFHPAAVVYFLAGSELSCRKLIIWDQTKIYFDNLIKKYYILIINKIFQLTSKYYWLLKRSLAESRSSVFFQVVAIKVRFVKFPHVKSNPNYAYFLPQYLIFVHTIMCGRCVMLLVIIICLITTACPQNSSKYCIIIKKIVLSLHSESE